MTRETLIWVSTYSLISPTIDEKELQKILNANEEDYQPDLDENEDNRYSDKLVRDTYTSKGFKNGSTIKDKNTGGSILDRLARRNQNEDKKEQHHDELQSMLHRN